MRKRVFSTLFLIIHFFHQRRTYQLAFMAYQVKMLKRRLDTKSIIPNTEEREELIALGGKFGHEVEGCLEVVTPQTYRRWLAKKSAGKESADVGRKPTEGEAKELVLKMKAENPTWGIFRIVGELAKLGIALGRSTVKRILAREAPPEPAPENRPRNRPPVPWDQFLLMHAESMFGCDFLKQKVYSLRHGIMDAFILVVIHHQSRRVYCSPATYNPDKPWLEQQVRNIAMWIDDENLKPRFMIHDRDGIFMQSGLDAMLKKVGIEGIKCAVMTPDMNAVTEAFNGTLRRECLNYFCCFSLAQINRIVSTYLRFYNTWRPHQGKGIDNKPLDKSFVPKATGTVRCGSSLGGLLKWYYRDTG